MDKGRAGDQAEAAAYLRDGYTPGADLLIAVNAILEDLDFDTDPAGLTRSSRSSPTSARIWDSPLSGPSVTSSAGPTACGRSGTSLTRSSSARTPRARTSSARPTSISCPGR